MVGTDSDTEITLPPNQTADMTEYGHAVTNCKERIILIWREK